MSIHYFSDLSIAQCEFYDSITYMKFALQQLLINRFLIVIIALFCIRLSSNIENNFMIGDANVYTMHQGNGQEYTYIQPLNPWVNMWSVWDTKWYISIAEDGYSTQRLPYQYIDNKGFLPLYPILIKIFGLIFFSGNMFIAGIVLSNIFLVASLYFILKLIEEEPKFKDRVSSRDVLMYLILFPTSYFLSAIYPESLFLLLSILVFYFVSKKKILLACTMFSLACLVKTFALFLAIPIALYIFKNRNSIHISNVAKSILTALSLPLLYCFAMYHISGDAFAYLHIQEKFFRHEWSEPLGIILTGLFTGNPFSLWHILFIVFGLMILYLARKKLPLAYTFYGFAFILFTPITGVLEGSERYMASLITLPLALALIIRSQEIKNNIFILFAFIQGFAIFWWIMGAGFTS